MKLCECGCGMVAPIASRSAYRRNIIKGFPIRFIHGHNARGANHGRWNKGRWKAGRSKTSHGYMLVKHPLHPKAFSNGYVYEHILMAENALGHVLPLNALVHHVNEIKHDNRNSNFVICEDDAYHQLIHSRTDAFRATGSPHALRCSICQKWGFPEDDMHRVKRGDGYVGHSYHRACVRNARQKKENICKIKKSQ